MKTIIKNYNAEFASEVMSKIPAGYIDKTIPGCGLTTVALENMVNTIVAVPNVELINNKVSQYPNNRSNNIVFGVKEGVTIEDINEYISTVSVIKIMVTYDSLWKVKHLLNDCHLIIDESQEILKSQKLKASSKKDIYSNDAVTNLMELAKEYKDTVSFISATPIPLSYMPEWVSEINQVTLNWEDSRIVKPILMQRTYVNKALRQEIIRPLEENGFVTIAGVTFKKMVIFINSVSGIADIIKKSHINKNDIRVIMGNTAKNDITLRGVKRLTDYDDLTKYTFITGSGFKGIDLYDDDAVNVVISNTAKDYNMIDLTTDLQQAISRIRTKNNVNYGKFFYIYNQSMFESTKEELLQMIENNKIGVLNQITSYQLNKAGNNVAGFRYDDLFEMYSTYDYPTDGFNLNNNLFNADKYFILETKESYRKGFKLKGFFNSSISVNSDIVSKEISYKEVATHFKANKNFEGYENQLDYILIIKATNELYGKVWTKESYAKEMINAYSDDYKKVTLVVRNMFSINKRYLNREVKSKLQSVYDTYDIKRKAKSNDLKEFMEVREVKTNGILYTEVINKDKTIK